MSTNWPRTAHHVQCPKSQDVWDHNELLNERNCCVLPNLRLGNLHDLNNRDIDLLIEALQLRNLCVLPNKLDHGDQPQRHNRDIDDLRRTATAEQPQFSRPQTGTSNLDHELHKLQAFCTVWTMVPVVAKTGNVQPCPRTARQRQNSALSGPRHLSLNHDAHGRAQGNTTCPHARGKHKPTTELKIRRKPSSYCMKKAVCHTGLSAPKQYEQSPSSQSREGKTSKTLSRNCTSENLKVFCTVWTIPPAQDVNRPRDVVSPSTKKMREIDPKASLKNPSPPSLENV